MAKTNDSSVITRGFLKKFWERVNTLKQNVFTAGTGLVFNSSTLNHKNSVTAKTTKALYPIAYDSEGHITSTGTAFDTTNATYDDDITTNDTDLDYVIPFIVNTYGSNIASNLSWPGTSTKYIIKYWRTTDVVIPDRITKITLSVSIGSSKTLQTDITTKENTESTFFSSNYDFNIGVYASGYQALHDQDEFKFYILDFLTVKNTVEYWFSTDASGYQVINIKFRPK